MKTFTTWMEDSENDDLLNDYLGEDDAEEARNMLSEKGEQAVEEWLMRVKKLSHGVTRAVVRALMSNHAHNDSSDFDMQHRWPDRGL